MTTEQDREYLTKAFVITPDLDRFQTLAELLSFIAPLADSIRTSPGEDSWEFYPKNSKFYPDGIVTEEYGWTDTKGYESFKSGQAETYVVGLRALTYGGVRILLSYPSALDRKT